MKAWARALALTLLVFGCATTMGNTPYPLAGYGLGAFGLFLSGLLLGPSAAALSVAAGQGLAAYVLYATRSIFLLVAVASVPVRALQAFAFARLRARLGVLGAGSLASLLGAFLASLLAVLYYGEGGLSAAFAFMDVLYLYPAYLAHRYVSVRAPRLSAKAVGLSLLALGLYLTFLSASTYLLPAALFLGLALLASSSALLIKGFRTKPALALLVLGLALMPPALLASGQAYAMAMRAAHYPFFLDSLQGAQWQQRSLLAICRGGDVSEGVYDPQRLRVLSTCYVAAGRVVGIISNQGPSTDGDFIIDIVPEQGLADVLTLGSLLLRGGTIHVEVVPKDQPGLLAHLDLKPGDRVVVIGALVLDTDHGWWTEIHPAWAIAKSG
ncbi:MAG: hypothetical protein C4339_04800 [Nitrososphaerota archaeon]